MSRLGQGIVAASVILALSGCGGVEPGEICAAQADDYGSAFTVAAALETDAAGAERWIPDGSSDGPFGGLDAGQTVVLCYLDGPLTVTQEPTASGEAPRPYDRAVVAVVDGRGTLLMAGYRENLPIRPSLPAPCPLPHPHR